MNQLVLWRNFLASTIKKTIKRYKGKKTIIIVSRNLDFLSVCEKIILLNEGEILEQGASIQTLKKAFLIIKLNK